MKSPAINTTSSSAFSDQLWLQTAVFILAMIPITSAALLLDPRTFNGINVWIKPLKFQISAVLHLATLYLVVQLLPPQARRTLLLRLLVWASCLATVGEIFIITARASQATASHFNENTPLDGMLYGLMGLGALTMLTPVLYLGIVFFIKRRELSSHLRCGQGLQLGIILGFVVGSILTVAFAGYMSANGSHWTSGQVSDAEGLWLFGWSQSGGDLRPAHFFAMHLMQALPVVGLLSDRYFGDNHMKSRFSVIAALALIGGLSVFTFLQALSGQPFLALR